MIAHRTCLPSRHSTVLVPGHRNTHAHDVACSTIDDCHLVVRCALLGGRQLQHCLGTLAVGTHVRQLDAGGGSWRQSLMRWARGGLWAGRGGRRRRLFNDALDQEVLGLMERHQQQARRWRGGRVDFEGRSTWHEQLILLDVGGVSLDIARGGATVDREDDTGRCAQELRHGLQVGGCAAEAPPHDGLAGFSQRLELGEQNGRVRIADPAEDGARAVDGGELEQRMLEEPNVAPVDVHVAPHFGPHGRVEWAVQDLLREKIDRRDLIAAEAVWVWALRQHGVSLLEGEGAGLLQGRG